MPTARELLEQADALMRRNRSRQDDDIPVLTDAIVGSVAERPTARASAALRADTAIVARDPIPTLTDEAAPIEAAMERLAAEGEPSAWLEFEDPEPSVIGDAPDSIAIVPPVSARQAPDEDLLQSAEHEEIELTSPLDDDFADEIGAPPPPPGPVPMISPTQEATTSEPGVPEVSEEEQLADEAATDPSGAQRRPVDVAAMHESSALASAPPGPPLLAVAAPDAAAFATAAALPAALPRVDEQERWDAMAEEIRMQVLQRIDLFTDTGLREQLGARLQPIADRASADLVATINQQVGELLRAYVAEAIEREIERWRRDN